MLFNLILPKTKESKEQLKTFENIFLNALKIKEDFFNDKLDLEVYNKQLDEIQDELDKTVYDLYNINN